MFYPWIALCIFLFQIQYPQSTIQDTSSQNWNITDSHKVILLGDTGKISKHRKKTVANLKLLIKELGKNSATSTQPHTSRTDSDTTPAPLTDVFGVLLGDNFYEMGVTDSNKKRRYRRDFVDAFHKSTFNFQFYGILGNHDYMGDIQTQINFTHHKVDTRWEMPNNYYVKNVSGTSYNATFIFIDTEELLLAPFWMFYGVEGYPQYHWLKEVLENNKYNSYIFVIGHHQVVSAGPHPPCPLLVKMLIPLFKKYAVSAYIVGHNHNSAYFRIDNIGYITTGSASRRSSLSKKKPNPEKGYFYAYDVASGFATLEVGSSKAYIRYYEDDGKLKFSDSYSPREYKEETTTTTPIPETTTTTTTS